MFDTKLSVVIPAYNEEQGISHFIHRCLKLESYFSKIEIIVVNDGSVDGMQHILEEISKDYSSVNLINLAKNSGHMAALTAGFKSATGEWIATVDADGQDDPMIIIEMYKKVIDSSADICFSRRKNRKQDSFVHQFFSPWFYKVITRH